MFQEEKELITINQVEAKVKDVKVTNKGIQLNLENVKLTGEQISLVSALVGGAVWVNIEERLPEVKTKKQELAEGQTSLFDKDEPELLSDADISKELGITIESGQTWVRDETQG